MPPDALASFTVANPGNESSDRARAALAAAESRTIVTAEDYLAASVELQAVKGKHDEIDRQRRELVKPIDEARQRVQAFFAGPLDFLKRAEGLLKRKMVDYQNEQERLRRDAQLKADQEAERERRKLAERAAKAEAAGKVEKAAALEQQAAAVVPAIVDRPVPKASGIVTRETWHAEVTDLRALVQAVAAGQAPLSLITADTKVIGQQARSLKGEFKAPGIRVWSDKSIAA